MRVRLVVGLGVLSGSAAWAATTAAGPRVEWTVLAYLSGDSDLHPWVERYAADLESAADRKSVV